jgi:hypothetical protein
LLLSCPPIDEVASIRIWVNSGIVTCVSSFSNYRIGRMALDVAGDDVATQILMVASRLPDAMFRPFGLKSTLLIQFLWPW